VEHWVDLLLPLSIVIGIGVGIGSGVGTQFRWLIGIVGGTIIALWLAESVENLSDRLTGTNELQVSHGFVLFVTLVAGIAVATAVVSSIVRAILPSSESGLRRPGSQLFGAILGAVNGVLFSTLVVLVVNLVVSGNLRQTNTAADNIFRGTDPSSSLSATALHRVGTQAFDGLSRVLPKGVEKTLPFLNQ